MSYIVIKAENLGKKYLIGHHSKQQSYVALRDVLMNNARALLQKTRDIFYGRPVVQGNTLEEIWALKDVNFDICQGESVGIIGRNGAGKSTLLKILSRITEPTEGRVTIQGRVASLLEVGTGFHPELTGRENIFLNGAIMGMGRAEIKAKFDEIVSFAEVDKFIDTPVKRYSSGMYVRLAFAVAAHLEPEILVVDEVLAVGDAQFQKKCLGKMQEVGKAGRTVLFVSHNMGAIKALCNRGVYLQDGQVECTGNVNTAVSSYLFSNLMQQKPEIVFENNFLKSAQILSISVIDEMKLLANKHPYDFPFYVNINIGIYSAIANGYIAIHIIDNDMQTILFSRKFAGDNEYESPWEPGIYEYLVKIPAPLLIPGNYWISVHIASSSPSELFDVADIVCPFELVDSGSIYAKKGLPWRGKLSIPLKWDILQYSALSD